MVFDGSGPLDKRCDGFDGSLWSKGNRDYYKFGDKRGCVTYATRAFATPIFVASATPIFVASATPYFRTSATQTAATPKILF